MAAASASTQKVVWLSVDPVRRKLDFYPRAIASRVEKSFHDRDGVNPSACVLGGDFFNATVHFHPSGSCYQTTPGMSMGRAGFKQPGYRSVKRVVKTEGMTEVTIFAKQVHGEWRIAANETDADLTFTQALPAECLIDGTLEAHADVAPTFQAWSGDDLASGAWDVSVVVWQWCRGVPERHGNLMALADEWWCPYLSGENALIEQAFSTNRDQASINILDRALTVKFSPGVAFGQQRDEARGKERMVRAPHRSHGTTTTAHRTAPHHSADPCGPLVTMYALLAGAPRRQDCAGSQGDDRSYGVAANGPLRFV